MPVLCSVENNRGRLWLKEGELDARNGIIKASLSH